MRFYQQQHGFYCGVDLHARTMHVCVVDDEGQTREHVNLPCDGGRFLKLIEPYREQLVVSCECMFSSGKQRWKQSCQERMALPGPSVFAVGAERQAARARACVVDLPR